MKFIFNFVYSILITSLVLSPAAFANPESHNYTKVEAASMIQAKVNQDLASGYQYFDAHGNPINGIGILSHGDEYFFKPTSLPGAYIYHVVNGEGPDNSRITSLTLETKSNGTPLVSRSFSLDSHKSGEENKLELLRAADSMDKKVKRHISMTMKGQGQTSRSIASEDETAIFFFSLAVAVGFFFGVGKSIHGDSAKGKSIIIGSLAVGAVGAIIYIFSQHLKAQDAVAQGRADSETTGMMRVQSPLPSHTYSYHNPKDIKITVQPGQNAYGPAMEVVIRIKGKTYYSHYIVNDCRMDQSEQPVIDKALTAHVKIAIDDSVLATADSEDPACGAFSLTNIPEDKVHASTESVTYTIKHVTP